MTWPAGQAEKRPALFAALSLLSFFFASANAFLRVTFSPWGQARGKTMELTYQNQKPSGCDPAQEREVHDITDHNFLLTELNDWMVT